MELLKHEPKTLEDRRKEYGSLTMADLVGRYNSLNPKTLATLKTFSTRAKAVDRILKREDELCQEEVREYDEAYKAQDDAVEDVDYDAMYAVQAPPNVAQAEAPAEPAPVQVEAPPPELPVVHAVSIKQRAMDLLMETAAVTPDGKAVGHPYDVILLKIKESFPACNTSIACLRWYSVRMREDEYKLPQRPRKESGAR